MPSLNTSTDRWAVLARGQMQVLRRIAAGDPLADVLTTLMQVIESLSPGRQASVLLLDTDGRHLRHGAAPSLPTAYTQAIDGTAIGPAAGSCGTAAWRREPVVVEDIATDPLWAEWRHLALTHGLRACWSVPVVDSKGAVLGTFAIYRQETSRPDAHDLELLELASQSAAIAIGHERARAARQRDLAVLEGTLEHMDQGLLILDSTLHVVRGNRRLQELLDYPAALCAPGTPFIEMARFNAERGEYGPGDAATLAAQRCGRLRAGQVDRFVNERPDGRMLDVRGAPLPDGGFVISYTDITGQVKSQRALRRSEEMLRVIIEDALDAAVRIDGDGLVIDWNRQAERSFGWRADEALGRSLSLLIVPERHRAAHEQGMRRFIASAESHILNRRIEMPALRRDGSEIPVELSVTPVRTDAGWLFSAFLRDLSAVKAGEAQRAALEAQLREAQKMEAIGTLASGIAHDFNNIIPAIIGNVDLARSALQADDAVPRGHLDQAARSAQRARSLVQQILTFSRREEPQHQALPLHPLLTDALAMLRALLPAGVALHTRLDGPPLWVQADATRLHQVLMNLCVNAWHALEGRPGTIEIGLAPLQRDGRPWAHLWVRDDGVGMDEAVLARIFEPFFTTKDVGQGTGLGLAVVHSIVAAHGGTVTVDSQPGRGSCFHVELPQVPPPAHGAPARALADTARGHGEHVLCIDDDEAMLALMASLLQRDGWRVTACGTAAEALALLKRDDLAVDIVVTDFNMPGASGLDLAREVSRLRPGLPVVLSSGYITDSTRREAEAVGVRALLRKENTLEELSRLLRAVLARPA